MANKRNQKNSRNNSHRHIFKTKQPGEKSNEQHSDNRKQTAVIEGNRIMNIEKLEQYTRNLEAHSARCEGSIRLNGEHRHGLASILTGHCSTCKYTITLETSKKVKGPRGYSRWECNLAAVWGQMATGVGHNQLEESMSIIGVPVMTKTSFINTERDVGEWWKKELHSSMAVAGREEKRMAEEKGSFNEGVPAITVVVDGGWSKRSHKHSYNAKSGVAIILGKATGKLLYIGVRNKYCHACSRGISIKNHVCFKNWSASSSEMETNIILEGFLEAERVHGVRYTEFIGDGDSSVHPTLLQNVPGWGHAIRKIECANHACKCYRGALERLVQENPSYKGSGRLTQKMRKKLVSAARCAIRMRSEESDTKKALVALRKDLLNGPRHCFGIHSECSTDFCTVAQDNQQAGTSLGNELSVEGNVSDDANNLEGIVSEQEKYWRETLADTLEIRNDTRRGGITTTEVDPKMMFAIQATLSRLVGKANQLLGNHTTNLAECWMHIRTKFDGGKLINRSQSGSWEHRCMGAGLRQNMGRAWGTQAWKKMVNTSPNKVFTQVATQSTKIVERDRKRKATDKAKESRRRSKYIRIDDTLAARSAYTRHDGGISPGEVYDDIPSEELEELKMSFYKTKVVITKEEAEEIEKRTQNQAASEQWTIERRKRITASKVGSIAKMRKNTKRSNKVQGLLYGGFRGNEATNYGIVKEDETRQEYILHQQRNGHPNLSADVCGVFISKTDPWLAASPDGTVHDPSNIPHVLGLVEIKHPYSMRGKTITDACRTSTFCLEKKDIYKLKRNHDYYYQIQCQLYCVDREWCDFVVKTDKDIHMERIYRDREWWKIQLPKLKEFYFKALLPELACPRYKNGGIRELSNI